MTDAAAIMSATVVTIHPDDPVTDAATAMLDANIGSLVIVDEDERLAGILTRTDFVRLASDEDPLTGAGVPSVRSLMETDVVTVEPETPVSELSATMDEHAIHHLPVVDGDGRLLGIVTTTDLAAVTATASG